MTTPIDLDTITLARGAHRYPGEGMCFNEAVSLLAGEPFSDRPTCVSPVLRDFSLSLNDNWNNQQRQELVRFAPLVIGTAGDGQDEARGYLALDWLIRTYTPAWLRLAPELEAHADRLAGAEPVADLETAEAAGVLVREAASKAAAAWAAARAAAWAAAWDAAGAAARAAAGAAARASLAPTAKALQQSALDLFERMIDPSKAVSP